MGKSGKLLTSLVNGVKALKSPSTREKSIKENSHSRKDRDWHTGWKERNSSVTKHGCMWSLGKSSSRHRSSAGVPRHSGVEVKDVQVQEPTQAGSQPPAAASCHYTDASMDEITSTLVDEIVQEEPPPHESYQEDWAAILKLSDEESEPEMDLTQSSQLDEQAALMIQVAIRRYLARRRLIRTLKAVIRLQAIARGRMVRKQAAITLRCIHALVKFQANARGWLVCNSEVGQCVRQRLDEIGRKDPMLLVEESSSAKQNHSGQIALDEQVCTKPSGLVLGFEPDKEHWGWAWLDRWMASRPWESSSSQAGKKKSAADAEIESSSGVYEGAQAITADSKEQDKPASFLQEKTSIPMLHASHQIPAPPPPPLPGFIKAASHSVEQPVVRATEESSENASSHTLPITTREASEVASLCTPPAAPTGLATHIINGESAPPFSEGTSVSSTPVSSEAAIRTLAHPEEPEGFMPNGIPDDLGPPQAEVSNPSIDKSDHLGSSQAEVADPSIEESSPPASSFQQQSESSFSSSLTTKEEDLRQGNSILAPFEAEGESDSAELGVNKTSVSNDEPARVTNEENLVNSADPSTHADTMEKHASGNGDVSILSKSEARNIKPEEQETQAIGTKCDVLQSSKDVREGYSKVKGNGTHAPATLSEEPAKRMGSILVKHDQQGEAASQSLPSYMANTQSSKAKARSQASPRPMPESPKQRLVSPKHSSAARRTPPSEGKGTFANPRQIVHVRSGSKGQSASTIRDGSTSRSFRLLGDVKSPAK